MRIEQFIQSQPRYEKYAQKFGDPLVAYFGKAMPDKIEQAFLRQASLEETALFYFGYHNCSAGVLVLMLERLCRDKMVSYTLPAVEGILTTAYWESWRYRNALAVMDTSKAFGRG